MWSPPEHARPLVRRVGHLDRRSTPTNAHPPRRQHDLDRRRRHRRTAELLSSDVLRELPDAASTPRYSAKMLSVPSVSAPSSYHRPPSIGRKHTGVRDAAAARRRRRRPVLERGLCRRVAAVLHQCERT